MNKIKISIIVPIYNVEKYLKKCIDSLINQTYDNLEIILVDDGSKDNSPEICDTYGKKYSNIKVIHKKNGGLSDARNCGLKHATGTYIGFVDSDDYVESEMYESLIHGMLENNCILGEVGVNCIYSTKEIRDDSEKKYVLELDELISRYYSSNKPNKIPRTAVWSKLFHKNLLKDKEFPVGEIHEDFLLTMQCFIQAKKIFIIEKPLYNHIYTNENSITSTKFNKKDLYKEVQYFKVYNFLLDCNLISYAELAKKNYYKICLQYYYRCFYSGFSEYQEYKNKLLENKNEILKLNFTIIDKLQFFIFFVSPRLYLIVRKKRNNV